jgi:hypothetical protein
MAKIIVFFCKFANVSNKRKDDISYVFSTVSPSMTLAFKSQLQPERKDFQSKMHSRRLDAPKRNYRFVNFTESGVEGVTPQRRMVVRLVSKTAVCTGQHSCPHSNSADTYADRGLTPVARHESQERQESTGQSEVTAGWPSRLNESCSALISRTPFGCPECGFSVIFPQL